MHEQYRQATDHQARLRAEAQRLRDGSGSTPRIRFVWTATIRSTFAGASAPALDASH